jgi:hypothetical protein
MLGMSKRGDAYLRTLLIHGARSAIWAAKNKADNTQGWLTNLLKRRHPNVAAVALANTVHDRQQWGTLAHWRLDPGIVEQDVEQDAATNRSSKDSAWLPGSRDSRPTAM